MLRKATLSACLAVAMAASLVAYADAGPLPMGRGLVRVTALANGEGELQIYGPIGDSFWEEGVTYTSVVQQLAALRVPVINVRVASNGGSVDHGLAIHNALKRHPARKVGWVDSMAASIASLITCACDEVHIYANAQMMLHKPSGRVEGDEFDLLDGVEALKRYSQAMAHSYAAKTKRPAAEILEIFASRRDRYFSAAEAVAFGLADSIVDGAAPVPADDAAAAAALTAHINALSTAPLAVAAVLRGHLTACAGRGNAFAALGGEHQRAALAHIEDPEMRRRLEMLALATAGGAVAAAAGGGVTPPAAASVTPPPAVGLTAADLQAAVTAALASERAAFTARLDEVRGVFTAHRQFEGVATLESACLADPSMTVQAAQTRLLAHLGAGSVPLAGNAQAGAVAGALRVDAGLDERDKFVASASSALAARHKVEKEDAANPFRGARLSRVIRACLTRTGVRNAHDLEGTALASKFFATLSTSDFPLILSNTANRALVAAYAAQPSTWRQLARVGQTNDFKSNDRITLGTFGSLQSLTEGGNYKLAGFTEGKESIQVDTKGLMLMLTRKMVINDDLGVFMAAARMLGMSAQRTVNEDFYALLASNPTMGDTGALFNNTAASTAGGHANLGTTAAISIDSIAAGELAMGLQRDRDRKTTLNLTPSILLAPKAKKRLAWDVLQSSAAPEQSNSGKANYAANLGLTLISDAEMDKTSSTAWYLITDPNIAPLIEVDFLDGNETPYVEEQVDFDTDSLKTKVRLDYGLAAMEWRAGWKNAGA